MGTRLIIGCGYLGSRVVDLWKSKGHNIFATTRSPNRAEELRNQGLEPVICDVTEEDTISLPQVDVVVYAVGLDRTAGKSMAEVYVQGLSNILKHLPPPGRFLYVSSTGVYGQSTGEWVDETSPTEPKDPSGKTVLEAEQILRASIPESIILRFAGIYGPNRLLRAEALKAGKPLAGNPEKWVSLIHVEDGAKAILAAEDRARTGETYNISDGHPATRRELFTYLAEKLGAPEPRFEEGEEQRSANRRVANTKMLQELQIKPSYPSYRNGISVG